MVNLADVLTAEYHTDIVLGTGYLAILLIAAYRLCCCYWNNDSRNSKVFTMFNSCICVTSAARAVWLFYPETSYDAVLTEDPLEAFSSSGWKIFLVSEMLLSCGSISFFSMFILLGIYWSHLLQKKKSPLPNYHSLDSKNELPTSSDSNILVSSPIQIFYSIIAVLVLVELINIFLFLDQRFNSYSMLFYDCVMFDIVSLLVLFWISFVTRRLHAALASLESTSQLAVQLRRLSSVASGINVFLLYRVSTETALCIILGQLLHGNKVNAIGTRLLIRLMCFQRLYPIRIL
jgi:hypothetical protein